MRPFSFSFISPFFLLIPPSSFSLFFSFFLFILFEAARNRNRVRHASTPVGCRYFFFRVPSFVQRPITRLKKKNDSKKNQKIVTFFLFTPGETRWLIVLFISFKNHDVPK